MQNSPNFVVFQRFGFGSFRDLKEMNTFVSAAEVNCIQAFFLLFCFGTKTYQVQGEFVFQRNYIAEAVYVIAASQRLAFNCLIHFVSRKRKHNGFTVKSLFETS